MENIKKSDKSKLLEVNKANGQFQKESQIERINVGE